MSNAPVFIAFAVVVSLFSGPTARASDDENLPAAVNRVERETGGRVLSAERRTQSGRQLNRFKVYTPEGRVRVMWDSPRNTPQRGQQIRPQASQPMSQPMPREEQAAPLRDEQR